MKFQVRLRDGYRNFDTVNAALKYAKTMSKKNPFLVYSVASLEYECYLYKCENGKVFPVKKPRENHAFVKKAIA